MRSVRHSLAIVGALLASFIVCTSVLSAAEPTPPVAYDRIAACLAEGKEVVLTKTGSLCVPYRTAADTEKYVAYDVAFHVDTVEICKSATDWRRLNSDTIRLLAANKSAPVAAQGI
ncbi:MAG: hypothetical protein QOG38_1012, partial [Hyphomicrobiales bacterium]|nr:hypothetical protein [Hyphomicrobiales bacterium]